MTVSSLQEARRVSECPHHPRPEYRECHHIGDDYVAVYWGEGGFGGQGWLARYGHLGKRGSMTSWADKELDYLLDLMRRNNQ